MNREPSYAWFVMVEQFWRRELSAAQSAQDTDRINRSARCMAMAACDRASCEQRFVVGSPVTASSSYGAKLRGDG